MRIVDIIDEVADGKHQHRDLESMRGVAVHRVGHELGDDAVEICRRFTDDPEVARYTGGQVPYTLIIGGSDGPSTNDGCVWQCLPLDEIGHHARRWSVPYLGLACIGDFRHAPPTDAQYHALVDVLAELCAGFRWDPYQRIKGHGEIKDAHDGSKAPDQANACPGHLLNTNALRYDVERMMLELARLRLSESGLVWV